MDVSVNCESDCAFVGIIIEDPRETDKVNFVTSRMNLSSDVAEVLLTDFVRNVLVTDRLDDEAICKVTTQTLTLILEGPDANEAKTAYALLNALHRRQYGPFVQIHVECSLDGVALHMVGINATSVTEAEQKCLSYIDQLKDRYQTRH